MSGDWRDLLQFLRCPQCRSPLILVEDGCVCTGAECRLLFGVRDEIPNLIPADAAAILPEEWRRLVDVDRRAND